MTALRTFLGLSLLLTVNGHPTDGKIGQIRSNSMASRTNTVLPRAQFSVPISTSAPLSKAKRELMNALRASVTGSSNFTTSVAGTAFDVEYVTNVNIGGQNFALRVDTGSSDTWVPQEGFSCFNRSGVPVPASSCAFGTAGFNPSASPTYSLIPNVNFNSSLGAGKFVTGNMAHDTVAIGDMVVPHQEIGIATKVSWVGDGVNAGLLGLASPNLTSAYEGTNPDADQLFKTQIPYNPLFYTAVQDGIVSEPYFSIALNRGSFEAEYSSSYDPNLGYVAFGGIAPVPVTSTAVTVPIQGYTISTIPIQGHNISILTPDNGTHATNLFYTVDVETMSFTGNTEIFGTTNNTIIDSGSGVNKVPTDVANAFAAAFDPPAIFSDDVGGYVTSCNATAPEFTVKIAGTTFTMNPADNLLPIQTFIGSGGISLCVSATLDGGLVNDTDIFVLGDPFLHNVVVTFNIETDEVTITQREAY